MHIFLKSEDHCFYTKLMNLFKYLELLAELMNLWNDETDEEVSE